MSVSLFPGVAALLALVPALVYGRPGQDARSRALFWLSLAAAALGPGWFAGAQLADGWRTGLGHALWLAIAASATLFVLVATRSEAARRLAPLLAGYLLLVGGLAMAWLHAPSRPLRAPDWPAWLLFHIGVAVVAYALVTLAAVAGIAITLQERALRLKAPTRFTRSLPAIAEGEALQFWLLAAAETLLGLAVVSGIVVNRILGHGWLGIDHKTVLSLLAFALIGGLLLLHLRLGISGRRAARLGLGAYLLLTLAYPGVKLVTDVLMAPRS